MRALLAAALAFAAALTVGLPPAVAQPSSPPAIPLPASCIVGATTEAAIRACFTRASNSGAATVIYMPNGQVTLTSPLPALSNVTVNCVQPKMIANGSTSVSDNWVFAGGAGNGTLLVGDGTFAAFTGNNTPLGSAGTYDTQIGHFNIDGCGFRNFTMMWDIGATNNPGAYWSTFTNNAALNMTDVGYKLTNMTFVTLKHNRIRSTTNGCGLWIADVPAPSVYQPGNSYIEDDFCNPSNTNAHGFKFWATPGSMLDLITSVRLQVNSSATAVSATATPSSGSTAVSVSDLTKWPVGRVVKSGTTASGYASGQYYVVLSRSAASGAGTITLGSYYAATAITASASTAVTLSYAAAPSLMLLGEGTGLVSQLTFLDLDLEANSGSTCTIWAQHGNQSYFKTSALPSVTPSICARNAFFDNDFQVNNSATITDIDGTSAKNSYYGQRGTTVQRTGYGSWYDSILNMSGTVWNYAQTGNTFDLETTFGLTTHLYPKTGPLGQFAASILATTTLNLGGYGGIQGFSGTSAGTWTLPTITKASEAANGLGLPYLLYNVSSYPLTVNTDGTQTFNGLAGLTSWVLLPGQSMTLYSANGASGFTWQAQFPAQAVLTAAGAMQANPKTVKGTATLAAGTATVTLTNGAIFSSSSSYTCAANDNTAANAVKVSYSSGSSFTLDGTGTDVVGYVCSGN